MKYLNLDGLSHLKLILKNAFASKDHTHTKSEITDYTDYELPTASADTLGGVKVGSGLSIDEGVLSANVSSMDWSDIQNKPTFATVATTGSYTDLSNKPTIPTNNNQLTNGAGYQTASDVQALINTSISSVMKYKGTVTNYSDLPADASVGDTYNITNSSNYNEAGDNAVWNGTSWDVLSGTIDLSNYVQSADLTEITNDEIDTLWDA